MNGSIYDYSLILNHAFIKDNCSEQFNFDMKALKIILLLFPFLSMHYACTLEEEEEVKHGSVLLANLGSRSIGFFDD